MKTISEMAEEHAPYTREDSWNKTQRCIIAQTSFKAGANYVLDEIEKIVKYDKDPHCIEFLKERIWRLKGEK